MGIRKVFGQRETFIVAAFGANLTLQHAMENLLAVERRRLVDSG
jgi:hypothetical protein